MISVLLGIEDLDFGVYLNHLWGVWSLECFGKQKPFVLTIIPDPIHQLNLTLLLKNLASSNRIGQAYRKNWVLYYVLKAIKLEILEWIHLKIEA